MTINNIQPPIGLQAAVVGVQKIVEQAPTFYQCGLQPPHFIIPLDAGNGQTILTEYIAASYANAGVRSFGGLDLFLEYSLNGSLDQMKKVFADIRSCAVYTNEYEGVVAMDIARLADHINETQIDLFIHEIAKLSASATFIFYIPSTMSRNMAALIAMLHETLDDVELLRIKPYSTEELAQLVKRFITEAGIMLEDTSQTDQALMNAVVSEHIANIKTAKRFSHVLIKRADFSGFLPRLCTADIQGENNVKQEVK